MGILTRRDNAARLVDSDIVALARLPDKPIIEHDLIRVQVYFSPEFGHDMAVDADAALSEPRLARPA